MTKPPLKLDYCFPSKIHVDHIIDGDQSVEVIPTCNPQFFQNKDKPRVWQVTLTINFGGKDGAKAVHQGSVEYVGLFTVDSAVPDERMGKMVAVTCPSLLYSAAKELIALLTGRGPFKTLLLPTVSFADGEINMCDDPETKAVPSPEPLAAPTKTTSKQKNAAQKFK